MTERTCIHCHQPNGTGPHELRPYGPGGADVCAECAIGAKSTHERAVTAALQFEAQLDTGEPMMLTPNGPKPLKVPR